MYRAILFDLDDTLYDLRSYRSERLRRALKPVLTYYPHLDVEALAQAAIAEHVYREQLPDFLRRQGVEDDALILEAHSVFCHEWFDQLTLYDDALHTLQALRPSYKLGLVTNGPAQTQRPKIEQFGLVDYLDLLIVSEEVGIAKPDPAIFMLALERIGATPAESLFVGDSAEYDLRGAQAAGMPFIWMNPRREELPCDVGLPLATIQRLAELPPLLEVINT
jgi:HAD superfamily hydrolase (TIGR01509 family)